MEPDDFLFARNARPCHGRRLRLSFRLKIDRSAWGFDPQPRP